MDNKFFKYIKEKYPEILDPEKLFSFFIQEMILYSKEEENKVINIKNICSFKYAKNFKNKHFLKVYSHRKLKIDEKVDFSKIFKQKFTVNQLSFNNNYVINNIMIDTKESITIDQNINIDDLF